MKLSSQIKPISYLKAHAAEIVRNMREQREPLIITQNGEAKVVIQDIESYEQTLETMALLKILALGNRQVEEGKIEPTASGDLTHLILNRKLYLSRRRRVRSGLEGAQATGREEKKLFLRKNFTLTKLRTESQWLIAIF
jgi:prevent-host-death family protein